MSDASLRLQGGHSAVSLNVPLAAHVADLRYTLFYPFQALRVSR